jgi:hypothetical protein
LLGLDFLKTFELDIVSVELGFLFVKVIVQVHHFLFSVLSLAFALVSFSQSSEFLLLDFNCKLIHALVKRIHNFIQRDDLSDELHGQRLQLIGLSIFLCFKDTNVVVFVKGN